MNIDQIKGKLVEVEDTIQMIINELSLKANNAEYLENITEYTELMAQINSLENIVEELGLTRGTL